MHFGIDVVYISRIKDFHRLANFILSMKEKELFMNHPNQKHFIAGRYAAKEAFLKMKEKGLGEIPFKDIEVLYKKDTTIPYILYQGKEYSVSLSHDGNYAIALVSDL